MIQKPLITKAHKIHSIQQILNSVDKVYKFHQSIKSYNKRSESYSYYDFNNCKYTLPIAGGSVISDHSIVELGLPIESQQLAEEYKYEINNTRGVIVILSDSLSASNVPIIHKKLNACYIIIPQNNNIELNDIDTSLVTAQQGPLSAIVIYRNECFNFYRGILEDYNNFGDEIMSHFSIVHNNRIPFTPFSTIYNEETPLFQILNDNDEDYILSNIMKAQEENIPLKHIFAQLEVILKPEIFSKMMDTIVERGNYDFTRKDATQSLDTVNFAHFQNFLIVNNNEKENVPYTKKWLIFMFSKYMKVNRVDVVLYYSNEITNIFEKLYIKSEKRKEAKYEVLADLLQNCVSTRASYGLRRKGLNHIAKRKKIHDNVNLVNNATEDYMYELFENECMEDGVLIFSVQNNREYQLTRNNRFLVIQGFLAGSFTTENPCLLSFRYTGGNDNHQHTMIIIPMLKKIAKAMKNPSNYWWRHVEVGRAIKFIRISLRRTVHETLYTEEMRK